MLMGLKYSQLHFLLRSYHHHIYADFLFLHPLTVSTTSFYFTAVRNIELRLVTALAYVRGFIWSPTCQHCSSWCIAPGQRHDPPDEPLICFRIGRLTTESSFVKKSSNCFISSTSSNVGVLFGGIMSVLILGIVRRSSLGDDLVCLQWAKFSQYKLLHYNVKVFTLLQLHFHIKTWQCCCLFLILLWQQYTSVMCCFTKKSTKVAL